MYPGLAELTETTNRKYLAGEGREVAELLREIQQRAPHYWQRWLFDEFAGGAPMGERYLKVYPKVEA